MTFSAEESALLNRLREGAINARERMLLSIIDRMAGEISRGPDPEEYVPTGVLRQAQRRAEDAERSLAEQRQLLLGATERVSALERAFAESIEVEMIDESGVGRSHREPGAERVFSVSVQFAVTVAAVRQARVPIKQWIGERIFRGLVQRIRVELSEHFGEIRDPFGSVAIEPPLIDAAQILERIRGGAAEP